MRSSLYCNTFLYICIVFCLCKNWWVSICNVFQPKIGFVLFMYSGHTKKVIISFYKTYPVPSIGWLLEINGDIGRVLRLSWETTLISACKPFVVGTGKKKYTFVNKNLPIVCPKELTGFKRSHQLLCNGIDEIVRRQEVI